MNWLTILCLANWIVWAIALALVLGNIADEDKDGPRYGPPPIK